MDATELAALLASPAMQAPDGVTPNFDNPPNENALAWFVTTICMVVATIFLCLRLYAVTWKTKELRVEEGKAPLVTRILMRSDFGGLVQ